jgi:hypothetical protein
MLRVSLLGELVITDQAGVGKTRLLAEVAALARRQDARTPPDLVRRRLHQLHDG